MWIGCSPNQTCVRFGEPQRRLASRGPIKPIQMRGVVDREQVTVEEEMLMLHSENWHEKHEYAPLRGPIDDKENKKRMKRFQIVQHNSYINSRQVIAKKVSIPLEKLSLQQVWPISVEIRASTRKPHWLLG